MITGQQLRKVVDRYDLSKVTLGTLGSHSALDIMDGAKDEGLSTLVVCQKGRETPYLSFNRLADRVLILPKFDSIVKKHVQDDLRAANTIFVPNRSFSTYVGYDSIEDDFAVPIFGSRPLLRCEDRSYRRNQYFLLEAAGIPFPRRYKEAGQIDGPVVVKIPGGKARIDRVFFTAASKEEFDMRSEARIKGGILSKDELGSAVIEELVIGTYFNFNFFSSPLERRVELLGIDRGLQTNVNDFVSLPARQQMEIDTLVQNIEVGHTPATVRESLLEKVLDMGTKFAKVTEEVQLPGIVGPFALESVVTADLKIFVYDVSMGVPSSPSLATTSPYSKYYFGQVVGLGRRIAMEIRRGIRDDRLLELVS